MNPVSASSQLSACLSSGNDQRLQLICGRNAYGCVPFPVPDLLDFGACTASCVSADGFAEAQKLIGQHDLLEGWTGAKQQAAWESLRQRLLTVLQLPQTTYLRFSASGTDVHHDFLAMLADKPIGVVSVAASETGRGVPAILATAQRYQTIELRHPDGQPRTMADIDAEFADAVSATLASGLHCVLITADVSKSGLLAPSPPCMHQLSQQSDMTVLVDACQFRLSRSTLVDYLEQGYWVALTGSKFMGGPSFSAMLIHAQATLPKQLTPYFESDFPENEFGLFLRTSLAVFEMERFFAHHDESIAWALGEFALTIEQAFARCQHLRYWPNPILERQSNGCAWDELSSLFLFQIRQEGLVASLADHQAWRDRALRGLLPAVPPILFGQAMVLGDVAGLSGRGQPVLRLSASAPWVSRWIAARQLGEIDRLKSRIVESILAFDQCLGGTT